MPFFKLEQYKSELLSPFPEIFEFGYEKYNRINLGTLEQHTNPGIEICSIKEGKYSWVVEDKSYVLYPKNAFVTMPWERHGSKEGFLDIGVLFWIILIPKNIDKLGNLILGEHFSTDRNLTQIIGKMLVSKTQPVILEGSEVGKIFEALSWEVFHRPLGYVNRVYHLLFDLLLIIARYQLEKTEHLEDNSIDLKALDIALCEDLAHDWSVEDMANIVSKGLTSFTNMLKTQTGFTPLNYLIQLRIEESKKLMLNDKVKITQVAWMCGFSSSQHFATTFKLKTGLSPSEFLKRSADIGKNNGKQKSKY